ncbi:MAG: hypothetical protein AAF661_04190 [Pseudomonadota bacterium]
MRTRSRSAEVISVIIVSLVCSAAMRTISATAEGLPEDLAPEAQIAAQVDTDSGSFQTGAIDTSGDVASLTAKFQNRASELNRQEAEFLEREKELQLREAELAALNQHLNNKIEKLEQSRSRLEETLQQAEVRQKQDVAHLIAVYEGMKAKKAGEIFNQMEPEFAAGFLAEMRSDRAAGILSNMSPENAYAISVILASRNAEQTEGSEG